MEVIALAKERLTQLEADGQIGLEEESTPYPNNSLLRQTVAKIPVPTASPQPDLFASASHPLLERFEKIMPDELSPREALNLLYQLKELV